ncbi:MAG: type II toxin-antitoxin system MqsA family antitoxin [Oscillospiraceae bacterium]|nr:type II toxin-antitoxin system MqsA family antitoxin [Oscillospiraceae bacterium]
MNCFMCKGNLEDKNTSFMTDIDNRYFIIKNVPSQVCEQCGDVSYADSIAVRLDEIIAKMESAGGEIVVVDFKKCKKNEINEIFVEVLNKALHSL